MNSRIILSLFLVLALVGCGPFHAVTFLVESPDLNLGRVSWESGTTTRIHRAEGLPYSETQDFRRATASLTADTYTSTTGTITATILVDGVVLVTDSVTASGAPASVTVTGYVPD